ncbi:hypothetical protein [Xiamenia xianingshaonis]|nr:hypothetical protein [Xiamenia xianingshaonis]
MRIYREDDKLYGLGKTMVKDPMGIAAPAFVRVWLLRRHPRGPFAQVALY